MGREPLHARDAEGGGVCGGYERVHVVDGRFLPRLGGSAGCLECVHVDSHTPPCAQKAAVEHYLKLRCAFERRFLLHLMRARSHRSRDPSTFRQEMHFLISYAPGFTGIRCGWHNPAEFLTQLKALRAEHMSDGGEALRKALDLANLFRLASGVDNFGCGRKPWFNAHTTVVVLTDGGQLSSPTAGPLERLDLTALPFMPPASITSEPYRWDQRVFAGAGGTGVRG